MSDSQRLPSQDDPQLEPISKPSQQEEIEVVSLPGEKPALLRWLEKRRYRRPLLVGCALLLIVVALLVLSPLNNRDLLAFLSGPPPATPTPIRGHVWQGHDVQMTIVNGVAYASTVDHVVYALRISDGHLLWRYHEPGTTPRTYQSATNTLANVQAPVVADGVVYIATLTYDVVPATKGTVSVPRAVLYALRASDGRLLWQREGIAAPPAVSHGIVYASAMDELPAAPYDVESPRQGMFYALRASDGGVIWSKPISGGFETPLVVGDVVYMGGYTSPQNSPGRLYALRASDGRELWSLAVESGAAIEPQLLSGDTLYALAGNGTAQSALYALRASDGQVRWQRSLSQLVVQRVALATATGTGQTSFSSPSILSFIDLSMVVSGGSLYLAATSQQFSASGVVTHSTVAIIALRTSDGAQFWRHTLRDEADCHIDWFALENGVIYAGATGQAASRNTIYALRATDGNPLWWRASDVKITQALVSGGTIYLSSQDDCLVALRTRDGAQLWRYMIDGVAGGQPLLVGATLYASAGNGIIYALDAAHGTLRWYYQTEVPHYF